MSLRGSIQFKTTPAIRFVFFLGVHCWELVAATQSCKLSLGTVRLLHLGSIGLKVVFYNFTAY